MKSTKRMIVPGLSVLLICLMGFPALAREKRQFRHAAGCPVSAQTQPISVAVTNPTDTVMHFSYAMPPPVVKSTGLRYDTTALSEIEIGNAPQNIREGEPVLPVIPAEFILPAGYSLGDVTVTTTIKKDLGGTYRIRHGEAYTPLLPGVKARIAVPNKKIYDSDNAFPNKIVEVVGVYLKRGVSIAVVKIHPAVYRPRSGRIAYYQSIDLDVKTKKGALPTRIKPRIDKNMMATLPAENPEALGTYNQSSSAPAVADSLRPLSSLCDPALSYQYVIITADSIKNATTDYTVRDLIAQKRSRGLSDTIITIEAILANYSGVDNAEKLRNFIIDAYNNWETDFVLLGGDINIIPMRMLWCNSDEGADNVPSDLYYQCLDGNYNSNGNSYWGEPNDGPGGTDVDLMAEVYVGRASAENKIEMSNFVYKTLAYENAPESSPFLRKALMAGEYLGFGGVADYATATMEEIRLGSSAHGYTTAGFASCPLFSVDTLYDAPTFTWPASNLIARMNNGTYSIYNHLGHANETYDMKLYNADADALTNTNFFFAYSQGCDPGAFDVDCFAEHMTTSTRHGAFAVIFNARYGWGAGNSTDGPSQRFDRQFWNAYFGEFQSNLGALNAKSHENNIWDINGSDIRWCLYETNLLGDPQTPIRGRVTGPSLAYSSNTISDISGGNGDGIVNPGETIDVTLCIANVGTDSATGVSALVTTTDPYITVVSGTAAFGTVACCGANKQALNAIRLSVSSLCPTPHTAPLSCRITDGRDSSWTSTFSVPVYSSSQISGYVRTLTGGNPITGAAVNYSGPLSGSVITDALGHYMFGGIDGTYKIVASNPSYLNSDTQTVVLPPSRTAINFSLKEKAHIAVSPVSFHETLLPGDSLSRNLIIKNTVASGNGDLIFTIDIRNPQTGIAKGIPELVPAPGPIDTTGRNILSGKKPLPLALSPTPPITQPFSASNLRILYATTILSTDGVDSFVTGLRSLTNVDTVKVLNCGTSIPNLAYLQGYDIVAVASSGYWADAAAMGNVLADYVDVRGKVCILNASFCSGGSWALGGRIMQPEYCPFAVTAYTYSGTAVSGTFADHPINRGVTSITSGLYSNLLTLQGSGISLGKFTNNYHIAAYNPDKPIVVFNCFPETGYWGGDVILMMGNAFDFLAGSPWLSLSSRTDTLAPGDSTTIAVNFKSLNMFGGLYVQTLSLNHNAGNTASPFSLSCSLTVDGVPRLTVSPASLNFGNVWAGLKDTLTLALKNSGNEATLISAITCDSAVFSYAGQLPISVPPLDSIKASIVFAPVMVGSKTSRLTINSTAKDNPVIIITLSGTGTNPPTISVTPSAFSSTLNAGDSSFSILRISNGGGADLRFGISANNVGAISFGNRKVLIIGDGGTETGLDTAFRNAGFTTTIVNDDALYDGTNPSPQGYGAIVLTDGTNYGSDMPVAGQNAIVTFVQNGGGLINTEWIGYEIQSGRYTILRSIIPFTRTSGSSGTETYTLRTRNQITQGVDTTFSVSTGTSIGTANSGDVVVSGSVAGAAVVAVQSGKGRVVSFASAGKYSPYDAFSNLNMKKLMVNAVTWAGGSTFNWLSVDKDTGTIAPTSSSQIQVAFRSAGLLGGNYYAQLNVAHNAPGSPSPFALPCTLRVIGVSRLSASPAQIPFGPVWLNAQKSSPITLTNSGTDTTTVTSIGSNNSRFTHTAVLPLRIPPQSSIVFQLTYVPTQVANDTDTLIIQSNAMDNPRITIVSTGQGILGPRIAITPTIIKCEISLGDSASDTLSIVNSGGDNLIYSIAVYPNSSYTWIGSAISGGTVLPGQTAKAPIITNARQLPAGFYFGRVDITHNAPGQQLVSVACTLTVPSTKRLSALPLSVNFGTVLIGRDSLVTISLQNTGNDTTTITSITSTNAVFTQTGVMPLKVPPFNTRTVQARFTPTRSATETGTLTIASNAGDNPSINLSVQGIGALPAAMNVSPAVINQTILAGDTSSNSVLISNNGQVPLVVSIVENSLAASDTLSPYGPEHFFPLVKGEPDLRVGQPVMLGSGGPDAFGYRWKDSDAPGGPPFVWRSIKSIGIRMPTVSACDDCFEARNISFAFPFYGNSYSTIYVSSNGFITFGAGSSQIANYPLPSTSAPANLIDILHDDLYPVSGGGIYFLDEGNKVTVQYDSVPAYAGSGYYTCQAVLKNDGTITLYYSTLTGTLVGCTVGIQNATQNIGLTVVYNASYLKNNFAVELRKAPKWLSISPNQATVAPGSSLNAMVTFDARELIGGVYKGQLSFTHNDPSKPQPFIVPCTLSVTGLRRLSVAPIQANFGNVWITTQKTVPVTLTNSGTDTTNVTSINGNNSLFTQNATLPMRIAPKTSTVFQLTYVPTQVEHDTGALTIQSNAQDNPAITMPLSGSGTTPPSGQLAPASLSYSLMPTDAPADQTVVLTNSGGDVLKYQVSINQVSSPAGLSRPAQATIPELNTALIYNTANYENPFVPGQVIVGLKENETQLSSMALLARIGVTEMQELAIAKNPLTKQLAYTGRKLLLLHLNRDAKDAVLAAIDALRNDPAVAYAEPNYIVHATGIPNDPYFPQLYGMHNTGQSGGTMGADIHAVEAWDRHTGNKRVIIGIIDTGIDYLHPDLAANIWQNPGEIPGNGIDDDGNGFVDDVHGYDFVNNDGDPMDDHYHGTHCAGTIGGVGNNGVGVAGVMWNASIAALKFLNSGGSGTTADAIRAVNYAAAMHMQITSNSWGGGGFSQALEDAIAAGGLFVVAAGNSGSDNDVSPQYPASYPLDNIIAVAATDRYDHLASFSCYGRTSVDLGAPGVDIYSCAPGNSYQLLSGTSMATPHVSGACGLVWSYNPLLGPLDVKRIILSSVDTLASLNGKVVTGGRLNAQKALALAGPVWLNVVPLTADSVNVGASKTFTATVTPSGLVPGDYVADITYLSNDPAHPTQSVRVTATIGSLRSLSAHPTSLVFDTLVIGKKDTLSLTLDNHGNAAVTVDSFSIASSSFYSLSGAPLQIPRFSTATVKMVFAPSAAGPISGVLRIKSNAQDNPVISVTMSGVGMAPPIIAIAPRQISDTLATGQSNRQTITVQNQGGSPLNYSMQVLGQGGNGDTIDILAWTTYTDMTGEWVNMCSAFSQYLSKYTITTTTTFDSTQLEAALSSKEVFLIPEQENGTIPAGTGMQWRGVLARFLQRGGTIIYNCPGWSGNTTAFLSEAQLMNLTYSGETSSGTLTLPQPNDSLFSGVSGSVVMENATSYCQINDNSTALATYNGYMVIAKRQLYNGRVITLGPDFYSYDANWAHILCNAVMTAKPAASWLSLTSRGGSILPGGQHTDTIMINAANLAAGNYSAILSIAHNDPVQPSPIQIPVSLYVSGIIPGSGVSRITSIGASTLPAASGMLYKIRDIRIGSSVSGNAKGVRYSVMLR